MVVYVQSYISETEGVRRVTKNDARIICAVVGTISALLALVFIVGYRTEPIEWWVVPLSLAGSLFVGGYFGAEYSNFRSGKSDSCAFDLIGTPIMIVTFASFFFNCYFAVPFGPILTGVVIIGSLGAFSAWNELPRVEKCCDASDHFHQNDVYD